MCNINLIYNKSKENDKMIAPVMNAMSYNSFMTNGDGEGMLGFNKDTYSVFRKKTKIFYKDEYYLLSTHQRFTTSGYSDSNIHPHETKNFIIQHNGIFTNLGDRNDSDTKEFSLILENSHHGDTIQTIKDVMSVTAGSYSIVLYSKKDDKLYYFKNRTTSMFMTSNKKYLVMSTNKANVLLAQFMLNMKGEIKEVDDGIIFDICENFKKVGTFDEKPMEFERNAIKNQQNRIFNHYYPYGRFGNHKYADYEIDEDEEVEQIMTARENHEFMFK